MKIIRINEDNETLKRYSSRSWGYDYQCLSNDDTIPRLGETGDVVIITRNNGFVESFKIVDYSHQPYNQYVANNVTGAISISSASVYNATSLIYHSVDDNPASVDLVDLHGEYNKNYVTYRWFKDGKYHRIGGPALVVKRGNQCISEGRFEDNLKHRIGGPSYWSPNTEEWHERGQLHRIDGPAVTYIESPNFGKDYSYKDIQKGKHRIGPKTIKTEKWYIRGQPLTRQINEWAKENKILLHKLTPEDIILIQMKWG